MTTNTVSAIAGQVNIMSGQGAREKTKITVTPTEGWFNVETELESSTNIPVSYISPEFKKTFFDQKEYISSSQQNNGWACYLEVIQNNRLKSSDQMLTPIPLAVLYFLTIEGRISLDGKVTVVPVITSDDIICFVTLRWGGKGWIFRSYPINFPRVLRRDRKLLCSANKIS